MGATQRVQEVTSNLEMDALLADLNLGEADEIMSEKEPEFEDDSLDEVVAELEAEEADKSKPSSFILPKEAKVTLLEPAAMPAKEAVAKVVKPPKEPKAKAESIPRKHYASKLERISDKLGDKLGEYTVLELADAMLVGTELAAKQQETLAIVKASGTKVQNRQTFIFEFIAGKSAKLNGVIQTALTILSKDGYIAMGIEGNLYKALIAKPYSPNAAKAMGGNTVLALKSLKVVIDEAGKLVANPNSLILAKFKAMGVTA